MKRLTKYRFSQFKLWLVEIFPLQITLLSSSLSAPYVPSILYFWTPGDTMERKRDLSIQAENQPLYRSQEAAGIPAPHNAAASVPRRAV